MNQESDFTIKNGRLERYVGHDAEVAIPDSVNRIDRNAFAGCKELEKVVIPDSVSTIDEYAFAGCAKLEEVTIPDSVNLIGCAAFEECACLKEVTIPDSVNTIEGSAFYQCAGLRKVKLPSGLRELESQLFSGCRRLEDVQLPDALEEIDNSAFSRCESLRRIDLPQSLRRIGKNAFHNCTGLEEVRFGGGDAGAFFASMDAKNRLLQTYRYLSHQLVLNVPAGTEFVPYLKKNCLKLFELILQDDSEAAVQTYLCALEPVSLDRLDTMLVEAEKKAAPSVTALLMEYKAKNISAETIEKNLAGKVEKEFNPEKKTLSDWKKEYKLKNIGEDQIELGTYCGTETAIVIPEKIGKRSVTRLNGTFSGKADLYQVVIPKTVTEIVGGAFHGCVGLTEVTLPDKLKILGGFSDCTGLTQIELPKSVTTLGGGAFRNCTGLVKVTLSPKMKAINMNTFEGCTALTEITLPEKCREVVSFAFSNCDSLQIIHMSANVKDISYDAICDCPNVTIYAPAGSPAEAYAREHKIPFVAE